jgi:MarR family transcriptional regulator for hemolysin
LARTAKAVSSAFDAALVEAGGSLPTWLVLLALKQHPGANQRRLAAAVGIQGATLTHHLNAMEADGLITRRRDPQDRRVQQVAPTRAGQALFDRLAGAARTHDRRLRRGLTEAETATLARLLGRLRENVDPTAPS